MASNGVQGTRPSAEARSKRMLECIESTEPGEVATLLKLLCFLGGRDIPLSILQRANLPRKFWNCDGEIKELASTDLHVGFLADEKLTCLLQCLSLHDFFTVKKDVYNEQTFSVDPGLQKHIQQSVPEANEWKRQAAILVYHTFPRDRDLETRYGILGRSYLGLLQYVLNYFLDTSIRKSLPRRIYLQMAETLLAASIFTEPAWKLKAVDMAMKILSTNPEPYLKMWCLLRRLTLVRINPDLATNLADDQVNLDSLRDSYSVAANPRSNAQIMRLFLALVHNSIEEHDFDQALSDLEHQIKPFHNNRPSTLEDTILRQRDFMTGKVFRFQGKFLEASERLGRVVSSYNRTSGGYRSLISHIADTFTELGNPVRAEELLKEAISEDAIGFINLKVSLAEAQLHQKHFKEAEATCDAFVASYKADPHPDGIRKMLWLRVCTVMARIYHLRGHLHEALTLWKQALYAARELEFYGWKQDCFIQMIIFYSLADINLKLGELQGFDEYMRKATDIAQRNGRRYWFTGLGTFWFDAIGNSIANNGMSKIDWI